MEKINTSTMPESKVVYLTADKDMWVIVPTAFLPFFLDNLLKKVFNNVTTEPYVWPVKVVKDNRPAPTKPTNRHTVTAVQYVDANIFCKVRGQRWELKSNPMSSKDAAIGLKAVIDAKGSVDLSLWRKVK